VFCFFIEQLEVQLAPHNTSYTEGDTLILSCETEGFPPAKIEWLYNDEPIPLDSRVTMEGEEYTPDAPNTPNHY